MRPGTIVEYRTDDGVRLGAVLDEVGKTKLLVLNADDDENRPARDDVTFTLAGNFDPRDRAAALGAVQEIAARVDARGAALDLREVWRAAEPGVAYEVRELARRCGSGSGIDQLALSAALRADEVFFRHRKGRYEARTADQVEERERQRELDARRAESEGRAIDTLLGILAEPAEQRPVAFEQATRDPEFRAVADLLRAFAANEDEEPRRHEAQEILTELEARHGRPFASEDASAAFGVMRALGLWSPHEVVALHRFGVPPAHSRAEREEAARLVGAGFDRADREDFTGWWTVTIDDAHTRDIDDGLSIRPTLEGGWEVAIHVADPDAWVGAGSALDRAARERGATIYLPTGPLPMFPDALVAAMSLVEGELRPALTTHVVFDDALEIESWRIVPSLVNVNRRLDYAEVDAMLTSERSDHAATVVADLAFIADELHARRLGAQAVAIDLPEPRVRVTDLDADEPTIAIDPGAPSAAHELVAEFMILTGELHAQYCAQRQIPVLYRTQAAPNVEEKELARLPDGPARAYALLLEMHRGEVTTVPGPHAGLGVAAYAQATSPIRRYGDIITQRQVKSATRGAPLPYSAQDVAAAVETVARAQHVAQVVQREAREYWVIEHLRRQEGTTVDATVLSARDPRRAEVLLTELGVRARAHLRGPASPGEQVRLRVERARPRRLELRLVGL